MGIILKQKSSNSFEERKEIKAMDSRRKKSTSKMCKKVNKWIDSYCEGHIKKEIKEEIDRHLTECPSCQELRKCWEQVLSVLSSYKETELELPGDFSQKLHSRLLSIEERNEKLSIIEKIRDVVDNLRYSVKVYRYIPVIVSLLIIGIGINKLYRLYKYDIEYRDIYNRYVKLISSGGREVLPSRVEVNRIVILNFNVYAKKDIDDLTLKIHLPEGLTFAGNGEVEKYNNTIVWKGGVKKGKNTIPVRVKVVKKGYWEIKMQAQKGDRIEEFRKPLNVT